MPVDFESYEADGQSPFRLTEGADASSILGFLAARPDRGFTPEEIAAGTDLPGWRVGLLLAWLLSRDLVRHKAPYWAVAAEGRLDAFEAKLHGLVAGADRFVVEDWGDWEAEPADQRGGDDG